ncbi:MAG: transcription termination factor Rho [Verrucomicrobiae bacterium]|nr:transcription termination factor Rho [Verrucomicrobiae bacterium]
MARTAKITDPNAPKPRRGRPPKKKIAEGPADPQALLSPAAEPALNGNGTDHPSPAVPEKEDISPAQTAVAPAAESPAPTPAAEENTATAAAPVPGMITLSELRAAAQNRPVPAIARNTPAPAREPVLAEGLLEISDKGYGFLRDIKTGFEPQRSDVFVLPELIRSNNLRPGLAVKGEVTTSNKGPQMRVLLSVNDEPVDRYRGLMPFEQLTTINPNKRFVLETRPEILTTRVIDLMTPIGRGQRGLIVAPPRTGKTTLLLHIANAISTNHPDCDLMVLLVDERPEEATEVHRNVKGEVIASTNDMNVFSHTRISVMAIEKAKRMVEYGKHVFLLLDSLTRLGRAFNNAMSNSGRTLSGGMDARGMEVPRKIFSAARNTEEAGSLTIIATALIDTGSRMDEHIFQEFKGTGNSEIVLDRKLADARIYPAIDIAKSGTRREELLIPPYELEKTNKVRRGLAGQHPDVAMERLLSFLQKHPTNADFLRQIP